MTVNINDCLDYFMELCDEEYFLRENYGRRIAEIESKRTTVEAAMERCRTRFNLGNKTRQIRRVRRSKITTIMKKWLINLAKEFKRLEQSLDSLNLELIDLRKRNMENDSDIKEAEAIIEELVEAKKQILKKQLEE